MDTIKAIDEQLSEAKSLARFFEVDVTIKLFGYVIFTYHYPPKKNQS